MTSQKRISMDAAYQTLNLNRDDFLSALVEGTLKLSMEIFWNGSLFSIRRDQLGSAIQSSGMINMLQGNPFVFEWVESYVSISQLKFREEQVIKLAQENRLGVITENSLTPLKEVAVVEASSPKIKRKLPACRENITIVLEAAKKAIPGLDVRKAHRKWIFRQKWNMATLSIYLHEDLASSHPSLELTHKTIQNILSFYRKKLPPPPDSTPKENQ